MKFRSLTIGIPKEIMLGERRVATIPETVKKMTSEGAVVLVEAGAGAGAFFSDEQYEEAGATIVADVEEIYQKSDVILKVKEPKFNATKNKHEVEMMKAGQYLITFLHPASPANHEMVKQLAAQGVIAITLDGIPRISRAQSMDALTSMSTVAGYKGVLMAVDALPKFACMMATAVGMIPPAKVLVVGTGVAGLQAVATAKRLGAVVNALDIRPDACEQAKSLGAKQVDFAVPAEIAMGEGGYANKLPEEWLVKEREALRPYVADADIIILTALIPGKVAPVLVTPDMVNEMRPGSVIVDIAIDQGGNCALTKAGEVINHQGITINGIQNIPGMVPTSSTNMFAKNVYNLVSYLVQDGAVSLDRSDEIIAKSLVTIDGQIVHAGTLEALGLA